MRAGCRASPQPHRISPPTARKSPSACPSASVADLIHPDPRPG
jgi:hypothetical protein